MIAVALVVAGLAHAAECGPVETPPESFQVAWIAPAGRRVGADAPLTVVRSAPLQELVRAKAGDLGAVLRALGLAGPREVVDDPYQIVLFDVKREWVCRPSEGETAGVPRCEDTRRRDVHRKAWTSCGYLADVTTAERTLDVFRIPWRVASADGFCLLPMMRFLAGRP